jgi:Ala-tRNA(Pro) deacylase
MPLKILVNFLDKHLVSYTTIRHPGIAGQNELDLSPLIPGNGFAKAIMVKADNSYVMVVMPAGRKLDLDILCEHLGAQMVEPVSMADSGNLFPGSITSPPFGKLAGIPVYIHAELTGNDNIAFGVGKDNIIMISYGEYDRLMQPKVISF